MEPLMEILIWNKMGVSKEDPGWPTRVVPMICRTPWCIYDRLDELDPYSGCEWYEWEQWWKRLLSVM